MRTLSHRSTENPFGLDLSRELDHWVVSVRGDLDSQTSLHLRSCLRKLSDAGDEVVVDLERVTFIDSAGIGALVDAHRHAEQVGRSLVLRSPGRTTRRILEMTGIGDLAEQRSC
jgi:anti-anti-sigma factor